MPEKYININFPFRDNTKGFFLDMNKTDNKAIKADIMHLILTNKGERLYLPDFGTNLRKFIFEPNDGVTETQIRDEIADAIKKYIPNVTIDDVLIEKLENNEHVANIQIRYSVNSGTFKETDIINLNL